MISIAYEKTGARRMVWGILFAAVLGLAIWLRVANPRPPSRGPDERFYLYYAAQVEAAPIDGPRGLAEGYDANRGAWFYPVPLRIGFYYPIAAVAAVFRVTPENAGAAVAAGASILQLLVLAVLGLRFFNRWIALLAVLLLACSPEDLAMARRIWSDGLTGCVGMIFLWLCIELASSRRPELWHAPLWICGIWFLIIRESNAVYYALCVLGTAGWSWRRRGGWREPVRILAWASLAGLAAFAVMAILCGGGAEVLHVARDNASRTPQNVFAANNQTGPWYAFPFLLWTLSPVSTAGCIAALAVQWPRRNRLGELLELTPEQREIAGSLGALIVVTIVIATIPPPLKNLRYISVLLGPLCLMGALGLGAIFAQAGRLLGERYRVGLIAVFAAVLIWSCRTDYARYRYLYLERQLLDLDYGDIASAAAAKAAGGR